MPQPDYRSGEIPHVHLVGDAISSSDRVGPAPRARSVHAGFEDAQPYPAVGIEGQAILDDGSFATVAGAAGARRGGTFP
jgi:hypothetical protein